MSVGNPLGGKWSFCLASTTVRDSTGYWSWTLVWIWFPNRLDIQQVHRASAFWVKGVLIAPPPPQAVTVYGSRTQENAIETPSLLLPSPSILLPNAHVIWWVCYRRRCNELTRGNQWVSLKGGRLLNNSWRWLHIKFWTIEMADVCGAVL
jgi:hypothetical protein